MAIDGSGGRRSTQLSLSRRLVLARDVRDSSPHTSAPCSTRARVAPAGDPVHPEVDSPRRFSGTVACGEQRGVAYLYEEGTGAMACPYLSSGPARHLWEVTRRLFGNPMATRPTQFVKQRTPGTRLSPMIPRAYWPGRLDLNQRPLAPQARRTALHPSHPVACPRGSAAANSCSGIREQRVMRTACLSRLHSSEDELP